MRSILKHTGKIKHHCFLFFALFLSLPLFSQNGDINMLRKINVDRNRSFDPALIVVTKSSPVLSIATPVSMLAVSLINHDATLRRNSLYVGSSFLLSVGVTTSLKYIVKRKRPYETYSFIEKAGPGDGPSFPSGHTTVAFATATSLSLLYPKWYVITPCFLWAGSVAYSRMFLGVHYPSDVLIGALIGIGTSVLCFELNQKIH